MLDAGKIDLQTAANMLGWRYSGFSVDNPVVRIEAGDKALEGGAKAAALRKDQDNVSEFFKTGQCINKRNCR